MTVTSEATSADDNADLVRLSEQLSALAGGLVGPAEIVVSDLRSPLGKKSYPLPDERDYPDEPAVSLSELLSERQFAILAWIAAGKSNPVIAEIIGVGRKTVEKECTHIYRLLQVEDRYCATVEFLKFWLRAKTENNIDK